jgi:1-acyl-sn-glycerol-3-phosphate acyltransferase
MSSKGLLRKLLGPVVFPPANRFAKMAATFDINFERYGFCDAARISASDFLDGVTSKGVDDIPPGGPLLIVSNHPGAYDGLVIASNLPRNDLKVVISGVPFIRTLPSLKDALIYTDPDAHARMGVVRSIIRQLKEGGALLIFPSGRVDPDPDILPGAEQALTEWSPSIELILKKVPQTQVMVTIVSGVISNSFMKHPLTRLPKNMRDRQRLAEFLQIAQQMVLPQSVRITPRVSFAKPLKIDQIMDIEGISRIQEAIIQRAKNLLTYHSFATTTS